MQAARDDVIPAAMQTARGEISDNLRQRSRDGVLRQLAGASARRRATRASRRVTALRRQGGDHQQ
jgi:hypothetical protein